jgi:hypothetical protein
MFKQDSTLALGARVLVRDAEWLMRRVDRTSTGGQSINVVGISELVRDKEKSPSMCLILLILN